MAWGKKLTNDFAWSASRGRKLEECARLYFYLYYQSWEGWEPASSATVRETYRLKKLDNRYTWVGKIVHDTLREAITAYRQFADFHAGNAIAQVRATLRKEWLVSKSGKRNGKNQRGFWGLVEHEPGEVEVPRERWAELVNGALENLEWWFNASGWPLVFHGLASTDILELDAGIKHAGHFTLDGIKIHAMPDVAYRVDGGAVVVDWKNGKEREEHADQGTGYAVHLEQNHKVTPGTVKVISVYLSDGRQVEHQVNVNDVEIWVDTIRRGIAKGRALLVDGDTERNHPLAQEAFPKTADLGKCQRCQFRKLCGR